MAATVETRVTAHACVLGIRQAEATEARRRLVDRTKSKQDQVK